jgi:hypothetical protein
MTPTATKTSRARQPAAATKVPRQKAAPVRRRQPAVAAVVSEPVSKPTSKPVSPPAAPAAATKSVAVKPGKKAAKLRPVLVRDSFTMPGSDFALIATLKATALKAQRAAKKSELLRAGLQLLATLEAQALVVVLDRLEPVKTGRPKKGADK